jgi:hypothetical protein
MLSFFSTLAHPEKLRELMGKWSKRSLTQPAKKDGDAEGDPVVVLRRQVRDQERLLQDMTKDVCSSEEIAAGCGGMGGGTREEGGQQSMGDNGGQARARSMQIGKDKIEACERRLKALTEKFQKARRKAFLAKIRSKVREMKEDLKNEVRYLEISRMASGLKRLLVRVPISPKHLARLSEKACA